VPSAGDTFEIITAASILGKFSTEILPALPSSLEWFVSYSGTSVELISTFAGDFDFDVDVDGADFLLIQRNDSSMIPQWKAEFGSGVGPLTSTPLVPKPETWVMSLAAVFLASFSQRKVVSSKDFISNTLRRASHPPECCVGQHPNRSPVAAA